MGHLSRTRKQAMRRKGEVLMGAEGDTNTQLSSVPPESCSVLLKLQKAEARTTPLQKEEAVFGVGSACFKTLASPLGGLRGGGGGGGGLQYVHM